MSKNSNNNATNRKAIVSESAGWILTGGRVVDRTGERIANVAIAPDGTIAAVGIDLDLKALGLTKAPVLDVTGCVVSPGFVDIHTHLREPGKEEAETIESLAEPFLVRMGFISRTPRGRIATPAGFEHLGLKAPIGSTGQLDFFDTPASDA